MELLNVPADFSNKTIERYAELNEKYENGKVYETYGQITIGNKIGSGRAYDLIPNVDLEHMKQYIAFSKENGIGFNYTLNTTCMSNMEFTKSGMKEILLFLDRLYEAGVRSLTVTLPSVMEIIRLKGFDFEIKASTVCQIINPNKAMLYKDLGVDKIVLDETINRDFDTIKRIRNAFGENVELITNVICHKKCIYEMFHHNQTSHDSGIQSKNGSATYYSHRCMMNRCKHVNNLLKMSWIRPEDMKYYEEIGIKYYKLQGRQAVMNGDPVRAAEAYLSKSFEGNLMDLLDMFAPTNSFQVYIDNKKIDNFLEPFRKIPNFCKNDCTSCNYCDEFVKKCTDVEKTREVFDLALKFYSEYDEYRKSILETNVGDKVEEEEHSVLEDFNFD